MTIQRKPAKKKKLRLTVVVPCLFFFVGTIILYIVNALSISRYLSNNHVPDESLAGVANIPLTNPRRAESSVLDNKVLPTMESTPLNNKKNGELPQWIQNYVKWHKEMREKFPGKALLEDPNAPPVLVRTCLGICGGLHDRIGQLPLDLYVANQTSRVLLIKWIKPQPIEEFLVPSGDLDWTFPPGVPGWGTDCQPLNKCMKQVRENIPEAPTNVGGVRSDIVSHDAFLTEHIHMLNEGSLKNIKQVRFQILGHLQEPALDKRLQALGEMDPLHSSPLFGAIFHLFFQPHAAIQAQINDVMSDYQLIPGEYSVVHCRVRHPKTFKEEFVDKEGVPINADKIGLPFRDEMKEAQVKIANHAIQCLNTLPEAQGNRIYFMSDSSDLVRYMTRDLFNTTYIQTHGEEFGQGSVNSKAKELVESGTPIVAREQTGRNTHIDKNKGGKTEEYYPAFVDLFIGIHAKCVSFGIGFYAVFASKISGTDCKVLYARDVWGEGSNQNTMKNKMPVCTPKSYGETSKNRNKV